MNMAGVSQTEIAAEFGVLVKTVSLELKRYRFYHGLRGPEEKQYSRHMDRPETAQNTAEWRAKVKKRWDEKLNTWVTVCPDAYAWGYGLDQKIKPKPAGKSFTKHYSTVNL